MDLKNKVPNFEDIRMFNPLDSKKSILDCGEVIKDMDYYCRVYPWDPV